jgi:hypothetical protein
VIVVYFPDKVYFIVRDNRPGIVRIVPLSNSKVIEEENIRR